MKTNSALLLTSTQRDLLHPAGAAWGLVGATVQKNHVVGNLARLVTAAREARWPVLHSPVEFDYAAMKDFSPPTAIHQLIAEARLLAKGSVGAQFMPELAPRPSEIVLPPRTGFSSFWSNDIVSRLNGLGVRTLYIAGMLAHACVESHARDAAENGFRPVVVRDAIGAAGDELLAASLVILKTHAHAVVSTDEAIKEWQAAA